MASPSEEKREEQSPKRLVINSDDQKSNINNNNNVYSQKEKRTRSFIKNSKLTSSRYGQHHSHSHHQQHQHHHHQHQHQHHQSQSRPERVNKTGVTFDNELVLQNLIKAQIEYLFSDYHLTNDTYLLARMQDNPSHWLSIDELCHNQKIRCLTNKKERILRALRSSKYLQLSPQMDRVRRPDFTLPKLKPNRDLRRTVFLYGIPRHKREHDIRKLLSPYGHIKRIHFESDHDDNNSNNCNDNDEEAPNKCVAQLIMKKKFLSPSRSSYAHSDHGSIGSDYGGTDTDRDQSQTNELYSHPITNPNGNIHDFSHLSTCFVVFESQSQATKCVKARVRAVDGMRCIHKYDYNKVAKKYRTAQMKGEKLSFTPPPHAQHQQQQMVNNRSNYHSRYHQRSSYVQRRSQTPTHSSVSSNTFYNAGIGRKKENTGRGNHRLGSRADRNSHDNSDQKPISYSLNEQNQHNKRGATVRSVTPNMKSNGAIIPPFDHEINTKTPQLYHPINTINLNPNPNPNPNPTVNPNVNPNASLPTRSDAAALHAAGYQHELYYLPIDDPNLTGIMDDTFYNDPLIAYDVYFGVDQHGQPTATHHAAAQLQAQTNAINYDAYRPQQQQQPQQQQPQPQHSYSHPHGYNGPRSAPYGPISAPTNAQMQYQPQQWQLDKLEKFKAAKDNANTSMNMKQNAKQNNKVATALSVLSSSNN